MAQRLICLLVVVMLLFSGCVLPGPAQDRTGDVTTQPKVDATDLPTLINELKKSTVHINYSGEQDYDLWGEEEFEIIGSGVIYSINGNDAYVITNRHVVDLNFPDYYAEIKKEEITVRTSEDDRFLVKKRLVAPGNMDLAILQFAKGSQGISSASVSEKLPTVGEEVVVIGMPEQLDWSVSKGIVSGIRSFEPDGSANGDKYTAVQTDAAINSGNSGGGMFTTDGRLVGINTWKYIGFDVEGLNFAISSVDFIKLKDGFFELPIMTSYSQPSAGGGASSIGMADVTYDTEYDSTGSLDVSFLLVDRAGRPTTSDGQVMVSVEDGNGNSLYSKSSEVKQGDFKDYHDYPFYGKKVCTITIPYSDVRISETLYADFTLVFTSNSSAFKKETSTYLPYALVEGGDSYGDDWYYDDYYYEEYDYSELKDIGASASSDGIEVKLIKGGLADDYYSTYYTLETEFKNTGSDKKEIEIRDAVLVLDGKQYSADFWYAEDSDLGTVYPSAAVGKDLEFYVDKAGSDATLFLELRVIEGNQVRTVDLKVDFKP